MTRDEIDAWIRYHSEIAFRLTSERTALESALIPVSAYILVAAVECYRRYPEMLSSIVGARDPAVLGRAGHRLATQIDPVHLWAVPNFVLVGRKVLMAAGLVEPADDERRLATVFDFWSRSASAYRFDDGTHQCADAGGVGTPFRGLVDEIVRACVPVRSDADVSTVTRLNALLTSYLFLLWFDTRSGYQDTGPYALPDGRTLLLRSYNRLGVSHFPWSATVGASAPCSDVVGAFVLRDVEMRVTDFGTSVTDPADYWTCLDAYAFFDVSAGDLSSMHADELSALGDHAKRAQKELYRQIAAMERRAKIDAGAYVYFTFLRPFAEVAGVAAVLDWTVPRDSLDLYPFLELVDGSAPDASAPVETAETYYSPLS